MTFRQIRQLRFGIQSPKLTLLRSYSDQQKPNGPGWKNDIYDPENDPMKKFTEAEQKEIKARILNDGRKLYWIGSGLVGGAFAVLGITYLVMDKPIK